MLEVARTRDILLGIIRPLYEREEKEIIEIKGEDMLFYGDCCKVEGKLEGLKQGYKNAQDEIIEIMEKAVGCMDKFISKNKKGKILVRVRLNDVEYLIKQIKNIK